MDSKPSLAGALALLVGLTAFPARAAMIAVDTTADDVAVNGNCTLREAIIAANTDAAQDGCAAGSGADTITVPAGTYSLTLDGADEDAALGGDLDVLADVTIEGDAAGTKIAGDGTDRVLDVDPAGAGITVTLANLQITMGGGVAQGGGIRNGGTLTLQNTFVGNNVATAPSGIAEGGGIYSTGPLTLAASGVDGNTASGDTGARGGGIESTGSVTVTDSSISGNTSRARLTTFAGAVECATLTMNRSAVTYNATVDLFSEGVTGGISITGDGSIVNSLVTTNHGICGDVATGGSVTFSNVTTGTVTALNPGATFVFQNTIVGGCFGCSYFDNGASFSTVTDDYNWENTDSDTCGMTGSDLRGSYPLFSVDPQPGDPAIDAGNPAAPGSGNGACEATDLRGTPRPIGPRCDIGAYEAPLECAAQPLAGCQDASPGGGHLTLKHGGTAAQDRLNWSWKSAPVTIAEFDTPNPVLSYTNLTLCAYDQNGLALKAAALAVGFLGAASSHGLSYRQSATGISYHNPALAPQGISNVRIRPGTGVAGRGSIVETGKGPSLGLPPFPLAPPVRVQLVRNDTGACWEATYSDPSRNDADTFAARSD